MKWISPALVLALVPAGIATGQTTNPSFDDLAPGPIAELLPDSGSRSSFRLGIINPKDVKKAPAQNLLPGDEVTAPRTSLINEPVPYSAVPQIQRDIYSLEDTFTLPRTPAVSHEYIQQQPAQLPAASEPYTTPPQAPAMGQTIESDPVTAPVVAGTCACGSNELAPDNCQCNACQGEIPQTGFADECSTCDSCEMVVDDCGCDPCGQTDVAACQPVAGREYFETEECGFADDRLGHRDIILGPIARHFKKHHRKKQLRHQYDSREAEHFDCDVADCEAVPYDDSFCGNDQCDLVDDVYQPALVDSRNPNDTSTNTLFNVSGVYFNRNTPDFLLSTERVPAGAVPTRFLSTGDADQGDIGGIDANLIRRRATGKGFELRYLTLMPGAATRTFAGNPITLVGQFGQIGEIGGLTHQGAFNLAEVHEVTRDMSVQNAEFNLLRMGRQAQTRRGQQASFEYLLGFRYFKFDESLAYSAYGMRPNTLPGGDITRADYVSEVENELYGAQFGGRSEISMFNRLSLLIGLKAGIFQNNLSSRQRASVRGIGGEERIAQVLSNPNQGSPYNLSGEGKDFTLLGEIDLGLTYRVTNNIRMRGGYKAIFVDDIAFADNQIGFDFRDIEFNSIPRANDDLVLHGGYFGLDFAF